ncbi:MAG: class I SAM-dependent DNA methyltransferase [Sandaracinaceae bacterium]
MTTAASHEQSLRLFQSYVRDHLRGDEKGEAQLYLDRLFQALGHGGTREAGAIPEDRLPKKTKGTRFLDLHWPGRVLVEMKRRGEKLEHHYDQALAYWMHLVPDRPPYVILCNFDDFWIYDFNQQLYEPMDKVSLSELPSRWTALRFLFPEAHEPQFRNNLVDVTSQAADTMATVFRAMRERGEDRDRAQRFVLQCILAMFAEDVDLLPRGLFTDLLDRCIKSGISSYDALGGLFSQMNRKDAARGGLYKGVRHFNGGLFAKVEPIELSGDELHLMHAAANDHRWSEINPAIFGTLFQSSMDENVRHKRGAHFTSEADIQKVVEPTITRPWRERIEAADTLRELRAIRRELRKFRVLDPACGSGNFLYVAYRELKRLETKLIAKVAAGFSKREAERLRGTAIQLTQFHGIDVEPFAVELARVTLILAKELTLIEQKKQEAQETIQFEHALPLDNLDDNIRCGDSLLIGWPDADAIIGNPPFQSKNKMRQEMGSDYVDEIRDRFPDVSGRADYCVYWFRRAHDALSEGARAGLVGTNTIRQNYSREGSLDYIVNHGGTITEAVSTQPWSGEAAVHVSIVNWIKGDGAKTKKRLFRLIGNDPGRPWEVFTPPKINAALSPGADVTKAQTLHANASSPTCFQGQTHGHSGFLLDPEEADAIRKTDRASATVVHPYMNGDDILRHGTPQRYSIDLNASDSIVDAMQYPEAFRIVQERVMDDVLAKAATELEKTGRDTGPRQTQAKRWWRFWRGRPELIGRLTATRAKSYIACARVTKRPVFVFLDASIRPNDQLQVFLFEDDYSFGVLQSCVHWEWFVERCSTLTERFRYTSNTVFDSFPWPQSPTKAEVRAIAKAARELRAVRREWVITKGWSLRKLYRSLELSGEHPLRNAQEALDQAVMGAYGIRSRQSILVRLLKLNKQLARDERAGRPINGPGPPASTKLGEFTAFSPLVRP